MSGSDYYPELEDLLADLNVLTDLEGRIQRYPELKAEIEKVIRPDDLEATIKRIAGLVRKYLMRESQEEDEIQ